MQFEPSALEGDNWPVSRPSHFTLRIRTPSTVEQENDGSTAGLDDVEQITAGLTGGTAEQPPGAPT
jgi:hypothetical protein